LNTSLQKESPHDGYPRVKTIKQSSVRARARLGGRRKSRFVNGGTQSGEPGGRTNKENAAVCRVCGSSPCLTYVERRALSDALAIVAALEE
jgi:hypothetical protein